MARKLASALLIASSLTACSSIKPLIRRPIVEDSASTPAKNASPETLQAKELTGLAEIEFKNKPAPIEDPVEMAENKTITPLQSDEELENEDLKKAEEEIVQKYGKAPAAKTPLIPSLGDNSTFVLDYKEKHYKFWLNYFSKREKDRFTRHVRNGLRFKKTIEGILEEEGLPKELFYVGLIESGYNTHIRSSASAVGPWQFIKGTAKRYKLKVDSQIDERRNIFKSTRAAANYFRDLYNIFGSWELALCAYNAGEYRIINAIRRGNTRDYKELVRKKLIPKETIYYIPKVAAAKTLVNSHYVGLPEPSEAKIYQNSDAVNVKKGISLSKLSKSLKVSRKVLTKLNPDIRYDYVGYRRGGIDIYVPKGKHSLAETKIKTLKSVNRKVASTGKTIIHKVRRGENLGLIARKYKTTVNAIKRSNRISRNRIYVGQNLKVPSKDYYKAPANTTYTVRRGDNLIEIGRKFGLSVNDIKAANGLRSNRIMVGQKLKLSESSERVYIVRRGDSLYGIAKKFGVSIGQIVEVNSLKNKTIFPSQKIILPVES